MSFVQQMLASAGLPVLFSRMGEPVDYFSVVDGLTHQLTAVVTPATGELAEMHEELADVEEVHVRIGRTRAAAFGGLLVGGIGRPGLKDWIVRTSLPGPERPYFYAGQVKSDPNTYVLKFNRRRVEQLGTGNQLTK